jgi:hypothetical protein
MSLEVLKTNALRGNNQILVASNGYIFRLSRKCQNYYRWKCCRYKCKGFIKTTKNWSNIKLISASFHTHCEDDTERINNLKTMITNHCQMVSFILNIDSFLMQIVLQHMPHYCFSHVFAFSPYCCCFQSFNEMLYCKNIW